MVRQLNLGELEFLIQFYKSNRCLWDYADEDYHNRKMKNQLYEQLSELILVNFGKEISVQEIQRKWKSLKTSLGRERKRWKESNWVHLKSLDFLKSIAPDETPDSFKVKEEELDSSTFSATSESTLGVGAKTVVQTKSKHGCSLEMKAARPSFPSVTTKETVPLDHIDAFLMHVNISLRKLPRSNVQRVMLKIQTILADEFEKTS